MKIKYYFPYFEKVLIGFVILIFLFLLIMTGVAYWEPITFF